MRTTAYLLAATLLAATACDDPAGVDGPRLAVVAADSTTGSDGVALVATGSGHMVIGGERRTLTFSAQRGEDGSASGTVELHARQVDARFHADVVCVGGWGGMAWIGARITTAGVREGMGVIFRVLDMGEGRKGFPDMISLAQVGPSVDPLSYCGALPWFPEQLFDVDGGITVTTPGSTSFSDRYVWQVDSVGFYTPCAAGGMGELISLDGSIQYIWHFNDDRSGGYHVLSEADYGGLSGTGSTTGDLYQVNGGYGQNWSGSMSWFPYTGTYRDDLRVIGPGPDNDFIAHFDSHITVNAIGDVAVYNDNWSVECR